MHHPTIDHWNVVMQILWYIMGTIDRGLYFTCPSTQLNISMDVYLAQRLDDIKSTNAYVVYLGHNFISWNSCKQTTAAWSNIDAKYWAIVDGAE